MILSGIFLNLKTINTVFLLDYHENLSQYGQKKFFTLCFPSINSLVPEFWNSFPAIQYPGARRLSPPVGQGEKREINWNILSGNHGAVSTTPISSKLRKEITVITKEKKNHDYKVTSKKYVFIFYWMFEQLCVRVFCYFLKEARGSQDMKREHFPENTFRQQIMSR